MKTIKELKKLGFEEKFVSAEESGDYAFYYLTYDGSGVELISDDYVEDDESQVINVFFLSDETNSRPLSDSLIEELVKHG